jgi:hypothetical protein
MAEIENQSAYDNAVHNRIKANANIGRRKRMEAAIANDSEDFKAWLLDKTPPQLKELEAACFNQWGSVEESAPNRAFQAAMKGWRNEHGFRPDFIGEAIYDWGGLTENQLNFARKAFYQYAERNAARLKEEAERKANAPAWVEGRQSVTGVVASTREDQTDFGPAWKMLLALADGRKLWSSIPGSINYSELKGKTVTMMIAVTPSKDDPTFGFGKRPTKAEVTDVSCVSSSGEMSADEKESEA